MASTRVRGLTIEINADMTGFAKTLKQQDKNIKAFNTELRDINKILNSMDWGFKAKDSGAIDLLIQKEETLHSLYEETKTKVENIKAALNKLDEEDPGNIEAQQAYQRELMVTQGKLEQLEQEIKDFGSVSKQVWLERFSEIEEYGEKIKAAGDKMTNVGRNLTFKVSQPIYNVGRDMVEAAADFETSMAKVEAVTQTATKQQIQDLSDLALQMSTTTKYSATEAADALYYMGLAGWDVDQMAKALPDVLALAAAGDMDLAKASDIVTDYTTAFGLSAEQVTYFVDVMAQTMANSNTDVEQLGQAFKYVAPVAGALGFSVEDVSFALGLMANNGIKASQAGTSLRQFMQRLAKPTAEVEKAMDELGLALEDDQGNAYSFKEILDQLRSQLNFTGMSSEELASQISLLDDAMENGELSEEEYGDAMEDIMTKAMGVTGAEKAKNAAILAGTRGLSGLLAIVNTTAEDYESLANTIKASNGAAQEMADIMLDTAEGSWLKFKRSVEEVSISLGQMLMPHLMKLMEKVSAIVKWFKELNPATKETVLRIAAITAAAGPLLMIVGSLTSGLGSVVSLVGTIGAFVISNPLGAVVAGLGIAVGALAASEVIASEKAKLLREQTYGLTQDEQDLIDAINKRSESYQNAQAAREEEITGIDTEYYKTQELIDELGLLVDENGFVVDANKERVQYILGELSEATGIEMEITGNIIKGYQDLREEIQQTIDKKREEALMSIADEKYAEALRNQSSAFQEYSEAADKVEEAKTALAEAQQKENDALELYNKLSLVSGQDTTNQYKAWKDAAAATELAQKTLDELTAAMITSGETYFQYTQDIQNYADVTAAVASGDQEAIANALTKMTQGFLTAGTATREMLVSQYQNFQKQYQNLKSAVENGMPGVTQAQVDAMKNMVDAAAIELYKLPANGTKAIQDLMNDINAMQAAMKDTGESVGKVFVSGVENASLYTKMHDLAENYVLGFVEGIDNNLPMVASAASRMANKAYQEPHVVLGINSPSKKMMEVGEYFSEGFAIGIDKDAYLAVNAANDLANRTMNAVNPYVESGVGSSYSNSINVTINGANIQNDAELADLVADRINREVLRRRAVYA